MGDGHVKLDFSKNLISKICSRLQLDKRLLHATPYPNFCFGSAAKFYSMYCTNPDYCLSDFYLIRLDLCAGHEFLCWLITTFDA